MPEQKSYLDRLKKETAAFAEGAEEKLGPEALECIKILPELYTVLSMIVADRSIPVEARILAGSVQGYIVLGYDLMPEGQVGPVGYLDDGVLALRALEVIADKVGFEPIRCCYTGERDIVGLIKNSKAIKRLLPKSKADRIELWLEQYRTLELEPPQP